MLQSTQTCYGLIQIEGPDAIKFLQGQVTCDVTLASTQKGIYGAHCNPKGRILFSFYLFPRTENCLWLIIPFTQLQQAQKDLQKYSVFSKIKISDISNLFPLKLVKSNGDYTNLPLDQQIIHQDAQGFIRQRSGNYWEIGGTPDLSHLPQDLIQTVAEEWKLLDIQQGIAHIYPETRESFTPEEINYPLIDAVSFRKGCYTGQEIVARMHYKGKHKRHAYRFLMNTSELPLPGSIVLSEKSTQKIGELVSTERINSTQIECLASIPDEEKLSALLGINNEKMQLLSLPYAIPVTKAE
jgi:tRNA-modifying protein YgfZ